MAIYGPNWMGSVPIIQILCFVALTRSIKTIGPVVFNAIGRPELNVAISIAFLFTLVPALVVGAQSGPLGAAIAWLVVSVPMNAGVVIWASRILGVPITDLLKVGWKPALGSALMGGAVWGLSQWLPAEVAGVGDVGWAWSRLLALAAAGALLYAGWVFAVEPTWRRRIVEIVRRRLKRA